MRYQVILSNTKKTITIREDELEMVLDGIHRKMSVIVREGIFNPSYYVAIIEDEERTRMLVEAKRGNYKFEEPSPFAHLLRDKLRMLSPDKRDAAVVEASAEERKSN